MMRQNQNTKLQPVPLLLAIAVLFVSCSSLLLLGHANAATFQQAFVRFDSLNATTTTGGRVCAKPNSVATEASVQVTFPTTSGTDYLVNGTATNWTVTTTGLDTGQTAWIGIGTATAVAGKTVTFPSGDLTVGTLYCFNFAAASTLTTSSAAAAETTQGTILTRTVAPANIDQTTYSESIITNDQVVISAIVPPSFTFVLSGNTDAFTSNLSTASVVSTSGRTVTLTTNAASGWIVWVKDLNSLAGHGALQSATAGSYKIDGTTAPGAASHILSVGAEDYGLATTISTDAAGGGVVSLDAAYDGTAAKAGTLDPTQFRPIATANGTANGDIISLTERATIAGQTPAANDYTDTMTVIGAGVF
jgi:hypothetical protein